MPKILRLLFLALILIFFYLQLINIETEAETKCKNCQVLRPNNPAPSRFIAPDDTVAGTYVRVRLRNGDVFSGRIDGTTDVNLHLDIRDGQGTAALSWADIESIEEIDYEDLLPADDDDSDEGNNFNIPGQISDEELFSETIKNDAYCYDAGFKHGRCSALDFFGIGCPPEDELEVPEECWRQAITKDGIEDGTKSVYESMITPP